MTLGRVPQRTARGRRLGRSAERDLSLVAKDLRDGLVTIGARRATMVWSRVGDPPEIDPAATETLRATLTTRAKLPDVAMAWAA